MRALHLLLVVRLLLLRQTLGTGALERRIAAAVEVDALLLQVRDLIDHRIEKIAVVGDQQQGARIALQPAFQPDDCIEVQVVGRLIEQQQVGRAHQRLRQAQAHTPAAGKIADRQAHLRIAETQAGQQLARPRIGAVAVGAVQLGMQTRQGAAVMGQLGGSQIMLHPAQALVAVQHIVHGQAVEGLDLLAHVGNAPIGRQQAIAGVRRQLATQEGEQAGFAGAVGTDQADFLAGVQGQLGVF